MKRQCPGIKPSGEQCSRMMGRAAQLVCGSHATAKDHETEAYIRSLMETALSGVRALQQENESLRGKVKLLEAQLEIAKQPPDPNLLYRDDQNRQLVQTQTGYTYSWDGPEDLEVGDAIVLPSNWMVPVATKAVVGKLGTTYRGDIAPILRRA